jgi:hypothetical protein
MRELANLRTQAPSLFQLPQRISHSEIARPVRERAAAVSFAPERRVAALPVAHERRGVAAQTNEDGARRADMANLADEVRRLTTDTRQFEARASEMLAQGWSPTAIISQLRYEASERDNTAKALQRSLKQ